MGARNRPQRICGILPGRLGRRALPRPLLGLWALLLLLLAHPAGAANEPVPMCGESAQSVEAPPPFYPGREATLGQVHCARQGAASLLEDVSSLPARVDDARATDKPLAYLTSITLPKAPEMRLPAPRAETRALPAGVRQQVERPPRRLGASLH